MIQIDIRFLKHLLLLITELFNVINNKYKDTPGERQYVINIAAKTKRQLEHIIKEGEEEETLLYIRKGIVQEADW
jgi:hypothetical protein